MHSSIEADNKLMAFGNDDPDLKNIVKACSEALMYAVAKCYSPNNLHEGFVQSFYPRDEEVEGTRNTKLLINVLGGGKSTTSLVKFSKFFLIIDAATASDPYKIMGYYQKFLTGLKKQIQGTKAGEAGFKVGNDGCFLNGNATIGESFKMIEDAIALSGANDDGRKVF